MNKSVSHVLFVVCALVVFGLTTFSFQQNSQRSPADAVEGFVKPAPVSADRPELRKTDHDRSPMFDITSTEPSSPVFRSQPKGGRITGFDFYRDPLGADQPFTKLEDIVKKES